MYTLELNEKYCGDHSTRFWINDEIGPCWRNLIFAAPFGLFLGWWGVGSFLLTWSRHPVVLSITQIGALDWFRIILCLILTLEQPVLLFFQQKVQTHEYLDALAASALQWCFLGMMVLNSAIRARKDATVMKIAAILSLLHKYLLLQAIINSGKDDYQEDDFKLRRAWMFGSFLLTLVACFAISCVARDFRRLAKHAAKRERLSNANELEQALLEESQEAEDGEPDRTSPEDYVGWFSQLTFSWLSGLMRLGYSRPLTADDLYNVRYEDSAAVLQEKLGTSLKKDKRLWRALFTSGVLTPFLMAAPLKFIYDTLLFMGPATLLRAFIKFLGEEKNPDEEWYTSKGAKLAFAMFVVAAVQTFTLHVYFNLVFRAGMRVRTALVTAIYNKMLRLSLSARNAHSAGELANLVSTDAQRMQDLFPYLHVVWSAPLQITLCTYFLWQELRWAAVIALGVIVFAVFLLTGFLASRMKAMSKSLMMSKDERVRAMTEALSTIKLLKLYGWETVFADRIRDKRDKEIALLRRYVYLNALTRVLWSGTPILVTLVTFGSFVALGGDLDAPTAFVSVTLLQLLRFPMAMLPSMFNGAIEANVSLKRIEKFLDLGELKYLKDVEMIESRRNSFDSSGSGGAGHQHHGSTRSVGGGGNIHHVASADSIRFQLMSPYPVFTKVVPSVGVGSPALEMVNGTFYWDDEREKLALSSVQLRMNDGEMCVVTGEVGSGKTALLLGLLGELVPDTITVPYVSLNGSVAYSPQVPWIRNASVRDNILFDEPFDEKFYNQVIDACALGGDLQQLPNGDLTEIGEKGINLSGGQKARVSLARAVYSRSDILLLESCFEAVDEHVASIIWQQCLFGLLRSVPSKAGRKRTVIVVTHSTKSEAEQVDRVIVMSKGKVLLMGSPAELWSNEVYRGLKRLGATQQQHSKKESANGDQEKQSSATTATAPTTQQQHPVQSAVKDKTVDDQGRKIVKLISEEKSTKRGVDVDAYKLYFRSLGGWPLFLFMMIGSAGRMVADISTSRWLAHWANDVEKGRDEDHDLEYYLGIYGALSCIALVLVTVVFLTVYLASLSASRWYHAELVQSIMRAPMRFFDSTPLGRITQRFTKDMNTLDNIMATLLASLVQTGFDVLATIVVVAMVSPMFIVPLPVLAAGYVLTQRYYVRTSRELKNLDSISLSPIFSHFTESLDGCVSVRAYKHANLAVMSNYAKLDRNLSAFYMSNQCNRWLAVRMEFVANTLVFLAAILTAAKHGQINASLAGMAVSYTLTVTQSLNWFVRMTSDFETNIVSVERIDEYAHHMESEAPLETELQPAQQWPERGEIVFKNLYVRYRADLEDVLRGLDLIIPAGAHVGVCGKTGCGKSTLFLALLRIVEARSGTIEIDGINAAAIGLKRLRESIAIIPQDAVLFHCPLRYNLDPTGVRTDAELWRSLEICELSEFVRTSLVPKDSTNTVLSPLDVVIAEGGADFSFGQRQLLCIARALLRKTNILLSDEASSGIDRITDQKIQTMIRREFASRTTLTIAHRLETIMHSDFVAVMDSGIVAEFGEPSALMQNSSSRFAQLANEMQEQKEDQQQQQQQH